MGLAGELGDYVGDEHAVDDRLIVAGELPVAEARGRLDGDLSDGADLCSQVMDGIAEGDDRGGRDGSVGGGGVDVGVACPRLYTFVIVGTSWGFVQTPGR